MVYWGERGKFRMGHKGVLFSVEGPEGETNIVRVVHGELHTYPALLHTGRGNILYYFRTE